MAAMPAADNAYFMIGTKTGVPTVAGDVDRFRQDASAQFPVGYKVEDQMGNVYRYCHFSTDVNRGVLVAPDISETGVTDTDNSIVAPGSANNTNDGTVGSTHVEITLASVSVDDYAGGRLVITDDTGEGYTYDIIGNTATDTPASGNVRFSLKDKIQVAVDGTSDFMIIPNKYANLEIATSGTDNHLAGVTCATMDVSVAPFGWIQTVGDVGILQDGSIAAGDVVQLSDGTNGAVQIFGGGASVVDDLTDEQIVGWCIHAGDSTGHGAFHINVD